MMMMMMILSCITPVRRWDNFLLSIRFQGILFFKPSQAIFCFSRLHCSIIPLDISKSFCR